MDDVEEKKKKEKKKSRKRWKGVNKYDNAEGRMGAGERAKDRS